MINSNYMQ